MKKTKLFAALVGALMISGAAFAQLPEEATAQFNQAAELFNNKKYAEAIPLFEKVISVGETADPASDAVTQSKNLLPESYFRQGGTFAQAGKFEEAIASLNKANEVAGKYNVAGVLSKVDAMLPRVYTAYGGNFFNNKDYAKAIDVFARAYAQFPNDTKMALLLAKSYAESGDLTKAEEIYKHIVELGGTHDKYQADANEAKTELAGYLLEAASKAAAANDFDGVVKMTDQVLAVDPTNGPANLIRLSSAINAKNYDAAIGFGEQAAEVQATPENKSNAYFYLGAAYQNKLNKAKAIEMYKKVTAGPNVAAAKTQITELSK